MGLYHWRSPDAHANRLGKDILVVAHKTLRMRDVKGVGVSMLQEIHRSNSFEVGLKMCLVVKSSLDRSLLPV